MKLQRSTIQVIVPASSANLGPGFDALGLSLSLYNRFQLTPASVTTFEGCDVRYQNAENAVYKAAQYLFQQWIGDASFEQPLNVQFDTSIPTGRGLGSSASCIVGGLMGANELLGAPYTKEDLLQMASHLEGHPDNVAAAIYGGLTVVTQHHQLFICKSVPVSDRLDFYLFIPNYEISTQSARNVLSTTVPLNLASLNIANSVMLVLALMEGDPSMLQIAGVDHLYEAQRKTLVLNFEAIKTWAFHAGACHVSISGSGPSILITAPQRGFDAMLFQSKCTEWSITGEVLEVAVDVNGASCQYP